MTTLLFVFYFEHFFVIPIILIGYYHSILKKNVGMNVKKANKYDFLSLDFGWNMAYG